MEEYIQTQANETIRALQALPMREIIGAAQQMAAALRNGNKLLLCGNGGSAADCQHIAAEFVVRFQGHTERPALPAIALTADTSILTACGNDYGYDYVFARQIEALAKTDDVLIAISTSGNSPNILRALQVAKEHNVKTISLVGGNGGQAKNYSDITIAVNHNITARIQEAQLFIEHILCDTVEKLVFPELFK
jgi:D-sedoheptulose 7-phosphate isomerase